MADLEEHFNNEAEKFDYMVDKTTPYYDMMLEALINAIPDTHENPRVLDLGCGTGNITLKVLERFPKAEITCLDLSENMLDIAKEKLKDYSNVEYVLGNFTIIDIIDKYDAIISSLALHHIPTDEEKEKMYQRIYDSLNNDGVFYNADVIKPSNEYNAKLFTKMTNKFMKKQGLTQEDMDTYMDKRKSNDIPTSLVQHINMLKKVGFKEIDVIWKYYTTAVYGGTKRE